MHFVIQDNGDGEVYRMAPVPTYEGIEPITQDALVEGLEGHFEGVPGMSFFAAELLVRTGEQPDDSRSKVDCVWVTFDNWETPESFTVLDMEFAVASLAYQTKK